MKRRILIPIAALMFLSLFCTADYTKQVQDSEKLFYQGKYTQAAKGLLPMANKENNDQLLFMLECGLMLHAGGEYEKSNKMFLDASKLADRLSSKVSQDIASLFLNETVTNYRGEDFELVLLHMYLGINFMMLDKPDEARVEFKRVDNLLRGFRSAGDKDYKQNLMAKYLYGIAFEQSAVTMNNASDYNDAYIEYKQINKLDPNFTDVKLDLLRMSKIIGDTEDYRMWSKKYGALDKGIPADAGELVLIYHSGQGAIKASRGRLLEDLKMKASITIYVDSMPAKQGITVAGVLIALNVAENPIPKFVKRSNRVAKIEITANDASLGTTYLLEDIENTTVKNFEEKYNALYGKVAAGIATKVVASLAAGIAAKQAAKAIGGKAKSLSGLIGAAVGAGVGVGLAANIKPDLRCWHTLPADLQVKRLFLKPGEYDLKLNFLDNNGTSIGSYDQKVTISTGKKTLLNYRTLF
jgi:hypothetical protein